MAEEYSVSDIVNSIKLEYPIFKDIEVSDKRNKGMSDNRQLEYYSKEDSPTGKERVDIFNPNLQGKELKNAIFGDMLHSAPSKSKEYANKKLQLINSRTPEQIEIDKDAYDIAKKQGEKRPFDKWFETSRSDAFIRGYLANQWEDTYYTEEQKELMNNMVQSLKNKLGMNKGGNVSDQTEKAFSSNPFKGKQTVKRLKNVARNVPILGTAFDVADIASSVATGNLGQAAVDTGLALAGTTPVGRVLSKGAKFVTKAFRKKDIEEAEKLIDNPEKLKKWQEKEGGKGQRQENPEDSKAAAEALFQGEITSKEARKRIGDAIPAPKEYTEDQVKKMMPTVTDVTGAMGKKAKDYGIIGVKGFDLIKGQLLGARLDIPAYNRYDKWVVSIHDGTKEKGSVLGYGQAIRLKNVRFGSSPKEALDIARRKLIKKADSTKGISEKRMGKTTIARAFGEYMPEDPYELQKIAADIIESGSKKWTQVGMNPYRGSHFYDKKTGKIIFDAEEMIQVGPLVLAKNVKTATISDLKELAVRTKDNKIRLFNEGGTTVQNQMEMTFMSEGGSFPDLTGDGIVTKKDILRGRGIDGFEEGGLRDEGGTVDPVSGNDVPSGSNKSEVRDDIPAMLSEGEFVFPADVVRYIGLSKLMELRQEAKMGLKVMEEMGQMGNSEEATLPDDFGIPDIEIIEDDDEELDGMDDDDDENDMDNMTESGRMMVMEKRAQGGVIEAQQGTVVPNQFEQMMGYGAGQGSTRYNPNRVPYTKADGTIVNVLEDYMGRPMQDTEGLTRVTPYQAGPVFGGGVQPVQPIQPVLPPMPVDPTDDTAARREQERKDKRKEAKEADRRKALDAQIDKDIINFQDMGDPRFVGKTEKEARDAYYGLDFSERAGMAKQDLGYKASSLIDALPLSRAAKTKAKAFVDKKTTTPEQRRKRKRDSEEGVGAFADKSLSREERQKDKIESDAIDKIKDKKEKDKARDKARKRREDRDKAAGKKRVADYKANKDSVRGQGGRAKGGLMKKDYP